MRRLEAQAPARLANALAWIATIAIIGIFATSAFLLDQLRSDDRAVARSLDVLRLVRQARTLVTDRETGIRGFVITGAPASLAPDSEAQPKLRVVLDSLDVLAREDSARRALVRDVRTAIGRWDDQFARVAVALVQQRGPGPWVTARMPAAGKPLFDEIRVRIGRLEDFEGARHTRRIAELSRFRAMAAAVLLAELVVLALTLVWLARRTGAQARSIEEQHASLQDQAVELEVTASELEATNEGLARVVADLEKERENARATAAELQTLVDASNDVVLILDRGGRYLRVPSADESVLYRPVAEMVGRTVDEVLPPETARYVRGVIDQVLASHSRVETSYAMEIQGRPLQFAGVAAPLDGDRVLWLARDVTRRREIEAGYREATGLLRAVVLNAPVAIVATDADLNVTLWNPAATAMFGWTADEVTGKPVPYIADEQQGSSRLLRDVALAGEAVRGHESERLHRDGHRVPVSISLAALDPRNPRTGWVVAYTDIRQRLELQRALVQSQKLEAIGRLAGGVAHDFNNVLTAIKGFAGLARMGVESGESPEPDLQEIEQAVDRAAALTRQLLAFSRRQMLEPRTVALDQIVSGVEPMLRRLIGTVALEAELDPASGTIYADPTQVEQVIMNLVVNARDATEGGEVTVRTSRRTLTAPLTGASGNVEPGSYAVLSVIDSGSGMSPEILAQIFDPFFTTKPAGKGTGLGLSTVYGIVRDSGGFVRVESELGKGTKFEVFFPRTGDSSGVVTPVGGTAVVQRARVLLVDDDAVVRGSTARHLRHAGHQVVEAADGVEALEALDARESIDIVVTDLVMPRMGGRELAEQLEQRAPGLPVLFISGYSDDPRLRERVIGLGAAYLGKPFTPDALLRRIDELLAGV